MTRAPKLLIIDKTGGLPTSRERTLAVADLSGMQVHLLCPTKWMEHGMEFEAENGTNGPVTVHTAPVCFSGYYARAFYRKGLARTLREVEPDLVHLLEEPYSLFTLQTIFFIHRYCPGTRIVFYTWENIDRGFNYPARVQFIYRYTDRRCLRTAHAAVCATPDAQRVLLNKGFSDETIVAPYGVESCYLSPETETRPQNVGSVIGYAGRLLQMKGVDLLIKALPQLEGVDLEIVGNGPEEDSLRKLADELNVHNRVRFLGAMPSMNVRERIKNWSLLVLPSRETKLWCEQLGRVLIEAMALGVPVVASKTGSIPWVVGDAGLLFEEDNLPKLVSAIQSTLNDHRATMERISKGKLRVQTDFTWPVFAKRVAGLYSRLLQT